MDTVITRIAYKLMTARNVTTHYYSNVTKCREAKGYKMVGNYSLSQPQVVYLSKVSYQSKSNNNVTI